jgi:DNA repair protein REV1
MGAKADRALDRFDDEGGEEYVGSEFGGFGDYFRRKKIKLQNLDAELRAKSDKPQVFRGVVAHINGYTQPSLNDLHKLIVSHGGGFMQYLDGKTMVTHIIASNLTPKKAEEFRKYRIVKPAWVVDSVKAGTLLPWHSYRIIDEGPAQKVLAFDQGGITSQANLRRKGYREQSDVSWYNQQLDTSKSNRISSQKFLAQSTSTLQAEDIHDFPDDDGLKFSEDEKEEVDAIDGKDALIPHGKSSGEIHDDLYDDSPGITASELETAERVSVQPITDNSVSEPPRELSLEAGLYGNQGREKRPIEEPADSPSKKRKMTAEEHNAILLADPQLRKSTVVHPGFLEQYYRESRLHHLSTWKSELKSEMQALADEMSVSQKAKQKRPVGSRRYILHVDFDCFFAAVSLKKHPELKDKPTVVAHGNGSGSEIASCNYVARKFGIKNGMWMKKAQELCSDISILPYDFPAYEETSRAFYEAIIATEGIVQSVSVDEALVDISSLVFLAVGSDDIIISKGAVDQEQQQAWLIAQNLRDAIKKRTDCDVSIGIGGNILLAKLALRKAKPAGQYYIKPEEVLDFIGPLEVQDLPGVAWNMGGKLEEIGIKLIKEIREVSKEKLINTMGPKTGEKLWEYARGIDRKEVGDIEIRKSVSAEVNWGVRFETQEQVDEFIANLCGELNKRLLKERVRGKQLTLKIMKRRADAPLDPPKHLGHGLCDSFSKATQLGVTTNAIDVLTRETIAILKSFSFSPGELRGIGVQMTKLESTKHMAPGRAANSQPMLQFKPNPNKKPTPVRFVELDPIEDPVTPKKPKDTPLKDTGTPSRVAFGADHLNKLTPSRKPLNIRGTQFILPTQVDAKVLAELPHDIRSKLIAAGGKKKPEPAIRPGDGFPTVLTALPNESQIDPEVFNALPPDMQKELLVFYKATPGVVDAVEAGPLRSLHKSPRASPSPRKPLPQPSRKRGRPPKNQDLGMAPLNTANFITSHFRRQTPEIGSDNDVKSKQVKNAAVKSHKSPNKKLAMHPDLVGIDPDYLAALPENVRKEVILQNRLARLRKKNATQLEKRKLEEKMRRRRPKEYLKVPPRVARPTFTSKKISKLPKLRDAIGEWVCEFRDDGPYSEDTHALGQYIVRVVKEEADMAKANACVRWFKWVVEEDLDIEKDAVGQWHDAVDTVELVVQEAVNERGLGQMRL